MPNFLHFPGGSTGFLVNPFNLMTTELNSLANGNTAVSSVGGSSGVFNQGNTQNGQYGRIWITLGGNFGATPALGGVISGWFQYSTDGGTTFEDTNSNTAIPRQPDFVIPLLNAAYSANDVVYASSLIPLPYEYFKVYVQNNAGASASLASSGNILTCGPVADQY